MFLEFHEVQEVAPDTSSHGWTDTAKTYARALNIDLMRLVDAEQKVWAEYFGSESPTFRQVVKAPTLVTHRYLELSFVLYSPVTKASCVITNNYHFDIEERNCCASASVRQTDANKSHHGFPFVPPVERGSRGTEREYISAAVNIPLTKS